MSQSLLDAYGRLPGVRLNMIVNESLQFSGADGSSRSISNGIDRELLIRLRQLSDLVITDVATAKLEDYKQSKFVAIEVWSESGDFRGLDQLQQDPSKRPLIFNKIENLAQAIRDRLLGNQAVLLETGPTLTKKLASLDLIDEVCLTVSEISDRQTALQTCESFCFRIGLRDFIMSHAIERDGSTYIRLDRSNGVA